MKQVSLLCLLFIFLCHGQVNAQCGNALVEKAASQSGDNAVYLREFKVKFDGSERGKAIPTAKFPVLLSKNTTYRFNVCSAEEYVGKAILQVYLKDRLIGTTFDSQTSTDLQYFDFVCDKAATYEVVMSFDKGNPGCAVGILSMLTETVAPPQDEELDILYTLADNPIIIYDDEDEFARIEVSIDNGTVTRVEKDNYILRPEQTGTALLTIRVLNRDGSLKEFKQKKFAVLALDKPYAMINGITEGMISKQTLINSGQIELRFSNDMKCNYRVVSFTMSDRDDLISGISSTSARLSKAQRSWLENLPAGTRIYIKNIQAKTKDNITMDIDSIELIIE